MPSLKRATFDFGLEIDSRTLRVFDPPRKFSSVSPIISYIQLGVPLKPEKKLGNEYWFETSYKDQLQDSDDEPND